MKILHFSDLHVWRCRFDWSDPFYPKRWLGFLNLAFRRRYKYPPELGERVMAHLAEQEADLVIFTGDLSTMSLDEEFERAAELMAPIREKWGERFICIPGNHDRYTPASRTRYDWWFPDDRIEGVRTWKIDGDVAVVAYEASRPFAVRSNGYLSPEVEDLLKAELSLRSDQTVILMGHYPYASPPEYPETWNHRLIGEERLAALVAQFEPAVYLHGHKHVRWEMRPETTPKTVCLNAGSAGLRSEQENKQAGYLSFRLEDGEVSEIQRIVPDQG